MTSGRGTFGWKFFSYEQVPPDIAKQIAATKEKEKEKEKEK